MTAEYQIVHTHGERTMVTSNKNSNPHSSETFVNIFLHSGHLTVASSVLKQYDVISLFTG